MRLTSLLAIGLTLVLAACTDHAGSSAVVANSTPKPPVNGGDGTTFAPTPPTNGGNGTGLNSTTVGANGGGGGGGGGGANPAPEPATLLLLGSGLAGLGLYSRARRKPIEPTQG